MSVTEASLQREVGAAQREAARLVAAARAARAAQQDYRTHVETARAVQAASHAGASARLLDIRA